MVYSLEELAKKHSISMTIDARAARAAEPDRRAMEIIGEKALAAIPKGLEAVAMRQVPRAAFPSEAALRAMKPVLDAARRLHVPRQ